jgi:serine/threonine-protein kinase
MPDMTQVTELRGSVLGKGYRLGQTVGDARDHLHEARHERIPGRFFIRVFPVESLARPEAAARIQRAARVASLLRDVHVVQILDFSVSGELPAFVVMQRTDADPLWLAMAQVGSLPLPRGVEIVESVAEALASGHRLGLVHGDLRPELVLLPSTGAPAAQVSGFGWSKEFRLASAVPQSAAYLAPEQLVGSATPIDERADQFALGAIAYELLGGKLPFSIDPAARAALLADAPAPPPLADSVDGISRAVDEVLRRALSFRPGDRFATVREFAAELKRAAQAAPEVVRDETTARASELPEPREEPLVVGQAREQVRGDDRGDDPREDHGDREAASVTDDAVTDDSVTASHRSDGALEPGQAEELAAGPAEGGLDPAPAAPEAEIELDGSDDEDLALGATHGAVTDEGKTQVTRSPFFEAGDGEDEPARDEADLDVDDIRYDDGRDRREEAQADGGPLPFVRAHAPAGRPGRPSPASASPRHTLAYGAVFPPHAGAEGGGDDEERWGERSSSDEFTASADDAEPADPASENTQPDGKPFPVHGAGRQVAAAWLARVQKQPHWVVGSVAALVFLIGLSILLARGPMSSATSAVAGPVAIRSPEPRHEPEVEPIRVEPILLPTGAPGATAEATPAPAAAGTKAGPTVVEPLQPQAAGCVLSVSAYPGAEIWLDRQDSGRRSPTAALTLACGTHELSLRRPDGSVAELESIELKPGQPVLQR